MHHQPGVGFPALARLSEQSARAHELDLKVRPRIPYRAAAKHYRERVRLRYIALRDIRDAREMKSLDEFVADAIKVVEPRNRWEIGRAHV